MTTQIHQKSRDDRAGEEGPLAALRRRIERARGLETPPAGRAASESGEDPLDLLQRRIASANDPATLEGGTFRQLAGAAPPPLDELCERIAEARETLRSGRVSAGGPERVPGDPLQVLRSRIHKEIEELGGRPTADLARETTARSGSLPRTRTSETPIEARLGRELLELLSERPLPGTARAEAVARLIDALDDPEPDDLRALLRILIFSDEQR